MDTDVTPSASAAVVTFEVDEVVETLVQAMDVALYAQIAERRSQLEDAETLRRARAL